MDQHKPTPLPLPAERTTQGFDLPAAPPEIRIAIWEAFYKTVPRTIMFRSVRKEEEGPTLALQRRWELDPSYTHPVSFAVSVESRILTQVAYQVILSHAIPGSLILFNFEIDTLALNPQDVWVYSDGSQEWIAMVRTASESLWKLKLMLKVAENNLENVQSIALDYFSWSRSESVERVNFANAIRDGFQNLRELILMPQSPFTFNENAMRRKSLNLGDGDQQDICRQEILELFRAEQQLRPNCRIPKIIFLAYCDPRRPQFRLIDDYYYTTWLEPGIARLKVRRYLGIDSSDED